MNKHFILYAASFICTRCSGYTAYVLRLNTQRTRNLQYRNQKGFVYFKFLRHFIFKTMSMYLAGDGKIVVARNLNVLYIRQIVPPPNDRQILFIDMGVN